MAPFLATSGSTVSLGSTAVDEKTQRVVVEELRTALVVGAEGELRPLAVGELDAEQLLVAADPRESRSARLPSGVQVGA